LLLWVVGGIAALCGALCYGELGAMFPRSSGEYNFLARSYHPAFGFLAGWVSATVGFAAPIALAAMAFGEYFKAIVPGIPPLVLGLAVSWLVALVHLRGIREASVFQNIWTVLKLVLIIGFLIAGFVFGSAQSISFAPSRTDLPQVISAQFAISLVFVMYSYSGWNAAAYIVGEIREPHRSLPRALFTGTLVVAILYVGLNAVFLYTTPIDQMFGQIDVAVIAGRHIFGDWGGRLVGALICVGLVSSISAMTWIGPRVTVAVGEDMRLLRMFAHKSKNDVPSTAILFQLGIVNLLLLTQSFEAVLEFIQFSLIFCNFFAVLGVVKLRYTHPNQPRPYRAWGYPITPLIFLAVAGFMMYYLVTNRPVQSLAGFGMMIAGLAVYYASRLQDVLRPRVTRMLRKAGVAAVVASSIIPAAAYSARAQTASADDTARFLAGMPPSSASPLAPLTQDPAWQQHARYFNSAFGDLDKNQFAKIRAWSNAKLTAPSPVLFYMFSGPDFLYANAFFPSATTYVMVGLEPVGPIPDLMRLPRGSVREALHHIEGSLSTILTISFFKTHHMRMTLGAGRVSGALPLLYVFLARTGNAIQDVSLIKLDAQGPQPENTPSAPGMANAAHGVKIVFAGADGRVRTLYYFSTNIANDGFKVSGFEKFCDQLGTGDAFVKSASYLLHSPNFSDVRNFLLGHTVQVLQDDTSIPVSYFAPDKWQLRPFGRYTGPIAVFARKYQPKLTQLFQKGHAESLDFGLGYRWRVSSSNLLLATRIEPQVINQPGAQSDNKSIASKGPDVSPDSAEEPATGGKKTKSKNGTKKQKSRTAAIRPAPFYFPFFFGRQ
jgi:APA family basic amino acid/polyamine antiporter